ncbi:MULTISPECIES: MarR family transcriptional regulator [unclassified Chelatococcus]|uniref:MarR family winged helix-turn-helix transcriptional regulator n=1 Tax=unclassified Chelatococcus TaxID=2638111 RepID=UPI001BD09F51|nr:MULTISPECIES: MarR family transcriptional regulator [unclassified Chelatococcus]CAH1664409.1 MarR family transcriptional regulator for hemolysin [Hyphomicrobiales bacterium]MBS7741698.1 MarR family transcriptional regulator [Chelatococcus sp. HY11]MBX3544283.1 MarR family transcriptional regulator [Chelatococcus sp.]MCO5079394.1 MarR family transcriptional regulator [Chelatococcus sp.]CAH1681812.1 MarR family transcriptional regulator for hemolysin [Hyphomicrobiales bacterium]
MSVLPFQERSRLGPLLAHAARQWRRAVDRHLQPFDLTEATWLPLLRIARAPHPMYQKDLAASLSLDRSSVVRLLDSLQRAGLVERREGRDRRTKAIVLTALGHATVQRVEVFAREVREMALADVAPDDLATTMRVLDHIATVLSPSGEEIIA